MSNDRSNVKAFNGFGARFISKMDRNQKQEKRSRGHKSNDRSNVKGFNGFVARLTLKGYRCKKQGKTFRAHRSNDRSNVKVLMVSVQD